jgi:hypothetical protein
VSNNPQQPQDEDQQQDSAKTDIHNNPPVFVLLLKRPREPAGCSRFAGGPILQGIILPAEKAPDLLDFRGSRRN